MPSCIHTDLALDGIGSKLQCSMFCMKRIMNRVPAYAITLVLGKK